MTPKSIPSGALKVAEECKRRLETSVRIGHPNHEHYLACIAAIDRLAALAALATPSPSPAATQEPYYLWSHPRETARVCRPSDATFSAGEPEWVREYPVEGHERAAAQVQVEERQPLTGWRSIDSAPKDGTPVLIFGTPIGEIHDDLTKVPVIGVGEWSYGSFDCPHTDCYTVYWRGATHWMPLPAPPGIGSAGTDGGVKSHE